jgi:hypothetical protein
MAQTPQFFGLVVVALLSFSGNANTFLNVGGKSKKQPASFSAGILFVVFT